MAKEKLSPLVVGLGEILWDCFEDSRRPGGAPANVAFQAGQLGCRGIVASRVGDDALGEELIEFLGDQGLDTRYIQRDGGHATGTVTVDSSRADHPQYTIHHPAAWDFIECDAALCDLMSRASAVCFGTLAQRNAVSRRAIQNALAETGDGCLLVCDINIRQDWYNREVLEQSLVAAGLVKLNEDEVPIVAEALGAECGGDVEFCRLLQSRFDVQAVCITRGARGCLLVDGQQKIDSLGMAVEVADAVGAGDAFTAAWISSRLAGRRPREQADIANRVGALVASRSGAMPDLKEEFADLI